jgi:hypothetical protein
MESDALSKVMELAAMENNPPILLAHDCLYYRTASTGDQFASLASEIQKDYPLLRIDHQAIFPIRTEHFKDSAQRQYEDEDSRHRAFIEAEQRKEDARFGAPRKELDPNAGEYGDLISALNLNLCKPSSGTSFNLNERLIGGDK